jgi:hypothetical protein
VATATRRLEKLQNTPSASVALAKKMARIAWAVLAKGKPYRAPTRSSNAVIPAAA